MKSCACDIISIWEQMISTKTFFASKPSWPHLPLILRAEQQKACFLVCEGRGDDWTWLADTGWHRGCHHWGRTLSAEALSRVFVAWTGDTELNIITDIHYHNILNTQQSQTLSNFLWKIFVVLFLRREEFSVEEGVSHISPCLFRCPLACAERGNSHFIMRYQCRAGRAHPLCFQ